MSHKTWCIIFWISFVWFIFFSYAFTLGAKGQLVDASIIISPIFVILSGVVVHNKSKV